MYTNREIGQRLKRIREDDDLTQEYFAEILAIPVQEYANYEECEKEIPIHRVVQLAEYYDVSLDFMVGICRFKL